MFECKNIWSVAKICIYQRQSADWACHGLCAELLDNLLLENNKLLIICLNLNVKHLNWSECVWEHDCFISMKRKRYVWCLKIMCANLCNACIQPQCVIIGTVLLWALVWNLWHAAVWIWAPCVTTSTSRPATAQQQTVQCLIKCDCVTIPA